MKKLLVATTILFFTAGCYKTPIPNAQQTYCAKETITQNYKLQPFKSIVLDGNTAIELVNGSYAADVTGLEGELTGYRFDVANQVLHVITPAAADNVTIKVFATGLKNITVTSNATVSAKNFKTAGLSVTAKGNGTVALEGQYAINKIYQRGNGRINIGWVDSDKLFVDINSNGPVCLAGTANNMVAKLTHNAQLDVRYLRAQKASIFTTDRARADILVIDTLEAFAIDKSNIYYYKRPHYLTIVTKGSGNVLHPDWIH